MGTVNTLQKNLNNLLEPYNIQATASILEAETRIVLAMPPDCTANLEDVRQLIMAHLSKSNLQHSGIVKIFKVLKEGTLETENTATQPITPADLRSEIFRIPTYRVLSQKEIRQYICQDWFTVLQDL